MDIFANMASGFAISMSATNLLYALLGTAFGTAVGVLPGLGPVATISMLLPLTVTLDPASGIIMLAGIYYGAQYGGSTTSILLNIPGEASSLPTCLDGYQMARNGRAGAALGMAAMASFIAGTLSVVLMSLVAPVLSSYALKFGPAEYASLVLCGLLLAVYLSEGSVVKGLLMMMMGFLLGIVGIDPIHGAERFTFGIPHLEDGINFMVVAMGFFALSEVFINVESRTAAGGGGAEIFRVGKRELLPTLADWRKCWSSVSRGSIIGFFVGVLPGTGAILASFMSYAVEKRVSKHPEEFGKGAIEGVAAPEAANNAAATGAFVPLLTLGIPGSNTTAMIFVALMMHGIQPGPLFLTEHPALFWGVITSMYIGNVMLLVLNLPLIGVWVRLLRLPYHYLALFILIIVMLGAYQTKTSVYDVGLVLIFGALGFFLRKNHFPFAPCVLAIILGRILERTALQALRMSGADLKIFIEKPISAAFLTVIVLAALLPLVKLVWKRYQASPKV